MRGRAWGCVLAVGVVACSTGPGAPDDVRTTRAAVISDGAHSGGKDGFWFLPPMVPKPALAGPTATALAPEVRIDRIEPTTGEVLAHVTTLAPRVHLATDAVPDEDGDMDAEGYWVARWRTRDFDLATSAFYRVRVIVDGHELGFADVDVVGFQKDVRNVDTNEYVPLVDDRTLRVKFRIEGRAVDRDGDGAFDWNDNCPDLPNADQTDSLGNGVGDACRCAAVTCSASDACHVAGECSAATGACSNPPAPDGTTCQDGTCASGACVPNRCAVSFGSPTTYPTGDTPLRLFAVDVNGDGKLDIVTSDYFNGLGVSLGNGDGTFTRLPETAVPGIVWNSDLGDIDGDGKIDAVVDDYYDRLRVLRGNGDGTFTITQTYDAPNVYSAWIGDVNDDAKADLVLCSGDGIDVRMQLPDGTFGASAHYALAQNGFEQCRHAVVRDVSGDGIADVIVALQGQTIAVLLGTGGGVLGAPTRLFSTNYPSLVRLADLDADGNLDIVAANTVTNSVSILRGLGGGSFGAATYLNYHPQMTDNSTGLVIADIDHDGKLDIAVASDLAGKLVVYGNDGSGAFTQISSTPIANPYGLAGGDFDGDGDVDFAVAHRDSDSFKVLLSTCR